MTWESRVELRPSLKAASTFTHSGLLPQSTYLRRTIGIFNLLKSVLIEHYGGLSVNTPQLKSTNFRRRRGVNQSNEFSLYLSDLIKQVCLY